jgi:hypothetical protein
MNSLEFIRRTMRIEATPQGGGKRMTIVIDSYDRGQTLTVNGSPMMHRAGGDLRTKPAWLSAARFVSQMIEVFQNDRERDTHAARQQDVA